MEEKRGIPEEEEEDEEEIRGGEGEEEKVRMRTMRRRCWAKSYNLQLDVGGKTIRISQVEVWDPFCA